MSTAKVEFPETLQEAIAYFADKQRALNFMMSIRWPDGVVRCPRCNHDDAMFMPKRSVWRCRKCNVQFSAKVGTVFEESPLGLDKWFPAFWMIVNAKNGISSCELHRALGVTQKTAWFMLHRIRLAIQNGSIVKLGGTVEVDESYIGGRSRSMNAKQRAKRKAHGTGQWNLSPVQGLLQRSKDGQPSRIVLKQVENNRKRSLDPNVRQYVLKGAEVHTDESKAYENIGDEYTHQVINHAKAYARGHVHTNGLENFWSLLKRAIRGTYVSVEPFHLFRYLDEQAFRFNERRNLEGDKGRFLAGLLGIIGRRLTYKKLIGQEDDGRDLLPATA